MDHCTTEVGDHNIDLPNTDQELTSFLSMSKIPHYQDTWPEELQFDYSQLAVKELEPFEKVKGFWMKQWGRELFIARPIIDRVVKNHPVEIRNPYSQLKYRYIVWKLRHREELTALKKKLLEQDKKPLIRFNLNNVLSDINNEQVKTAEYTLVPLTGCYEDPK